MVNFLIHRPIAVTMTFIAILVMGFMAMRYIPVSLMPDIAIPEITVQVNAKNMPARELENAVVKIIRRGLLQTSGLADIKSETRDGSAIIQLKFDYGTRIDYAFIEVNEKIDKAMSTLPRTVERPKVIKSSATDIPVFYLNLTLKHDHSASGVRLASSSNNEENLSPSDSNNTTVNVKFIELSRFASQVIRKRLEQLPEVAMADISGQVFPELLIIPDEKKLAGMNISISQIENAIKTNNINLGNLLIIDGQYQYNIRFSSVVRTVRDIEDIYIDAGGRLLQIKDFAEVVEQPQKREGLATFNGKDAIPIAIIKQSDARMGDLKNKLHGMVGIFKADYPHIDFHISRDQTRLLDYSIGNLQQSLTWGALLAFIVMFFFLKDYRSPLLIGITIPASIVLSLLFFYLVGISINIISLSGLVLGVGMMVDNSIIVIDNITQYRERGYPLNEACVNGTNEVFRPMLSSVLTTCAVFVPLIFISGIAGALFYDQAMAVAIGLFVSLGVSIILLPVYYRLLHLKTRSERINRFLERLNSMDYIKTYKKGFRFTMRNQLIVWVAFGLLLLVNIFLYIDLPKTRLPYIATSEVVLKIDWNEKINVNENKRRTERLVETIEGDILESMCLIGKQQFMLDRKGSTDASEALVYFKTVSPEMLEQVKQELETELTNQYVSAVYAFEEAENIFDLIFAEDQPPLIAQLRSVEDVGTGQVSLLEKLVKKIDGEMPGQIANQPVWQEYAMLKVNRLKMITYGIGYETLYEKLKTELNEKEIFLVSDNQYFVPVVLGGESRLFNEILSKTYVQNQKGDAYPVRDFIYETKSYDLKTIVSGQGGEYYPLHFDTSDKHVKQIMSQIREVVRQDGIFEVDFSGSIFTNKELIVQLASVLLISLLLLYFILASQFESLNLPWIILLEIPIAVFGAFLFLKLGGGSINLMSMIGIVVMSGIVINDSILKIDTVNQLRKEGMPLIKALMVAGERRLKPILMTSITTVLALLPLFFSSGLGADLQKPLAMAIIGGMTIGTLVSLYFIPLCYYYLKKGKA